MAHVAAHDLGAAAYAIRAASACVPADDAAQARAKEREWQRVHLPAAIRELVLDDQQRPERHLYSAADQARSPHCHPTSTPRCRQHTKDYATDHPTRRRQRVHGNSSSVVNTFTVVVSRRRWAPRRVEDGSRWHMQVDAVEHPLSPKDLRSPVAVIAGGDWVFLVLVCAVALRRTARRATLGRWR